MGNDDVNCNQCGAPMRVATAVNVVTCGRCGTPLAIRRTTIGVHAERAEMPTDIATEDILERMQSIRGIELRLQAEINRLEKQLNRLDLDWEKKKQQYLMPGRFGLYIPTKVGAIAGGILGSLFGIFCATLSFTLDLDGLFRAFFIFFGVFVTGICIYGNVREYLKADGYDRAFRAYMQERSEVYREIGAAKES